ncbi:MAG: NAD(P)/FAD-dependent oxidoreductase [Alphaproteobacteria bacterium]|nr:NAD(P)/FAD-dependent oxidoreductase [Alphaproteobacteria bacterium]
MRVAIVGGGVSGCYCAYRLAQAHPDWEIQLYEASDRIGGRLWSVPVEGVEGLPPAELGGMHISDKHHHLFKLIEHLGLKPNLRLMERSNKHYYLRGVQLTEASFKEGKVPYQLQGREAKKTPDALFGLALIRIVSGLAGLWPFKDSGSPAKTFEYIRNLNHMDGRPLKECGFWNVLSDRVSNEAYDLLLATIGLGSVLRNVNAVECLWTMVRNMEEQNYFQLADGYQQVPRKLLERAAQEGRVTQQLEHTLREIRVGERDRFELRFEVGEGEHKKIDTVDKVILALPRRALQLVDYQAELFDDLDDFQKNLNSVLSWPACKVFMTFNEPWWDKSLIERADDVLVVRQSNTDLPMRQCYYYGRPKAHGPSMLLAAFTDDVAASFWSALAIDAKKHHNSVMAPDDQWVTQCSEAMVAAARRQLTAMHGFEVPDPSGAFYVDWGRDPYGGGWHDWAPNCQSWQIIPKIRHPNPARALFICGEAYSQRHGWVEGAINSAEGVLRRLHVGAPDWMEEDFVFEVEEEAEMNNKLIELLVALSENLALQRAYARDKDAIMKAFGLSAEQMDALKSGSLEQIQMLSGDVGMFSSIVTIKLPCDDH